MSPVETKKPGAEEKEGKDELPCLAGIESEGKLCSFLLQ